jgi:hypothetical protein
VAIAGAATHVSTEVDYVEAFGPTAGGIVSLGIGYLVKDKLGS